MSVLYTSYCLFMFLATVLKSDKSNCYMVSCLYRLFNSIMDILFPRRCCVCGRRLLLNEEDLCIKCLTQLPLTHIDGRKNNVVERLLWDDAVYTERASSLLYYRPKSNYCCIYFKFKYQHQPQVAVAFGKMMAHELVDTGFFKGIDVMLPIPLSNNRIKQRGYNQSERLAYGMSLITHIPIDTSSVVRVVDNPTQTRLYGKERFENVRNVFQLVSPQTLRGKHVLIIDDMITTGSTIRACARVVLQAGNVKISVLSLGLSAKNRDSVNVPQWRRQ